MNANFPSRLWQIGSHPFFQSGRWRVMASYRAQPSRADRATAIVAVIGVHAALAALILSGQPPVPEAVERVRTTLIDIEEPTPPPPLPDPDQAREEEGAAGRTAEPTPVVAPRPRIVVPANPPVPAAPVAGTGSSASAGAATSGAGTGAGGSGTGRGGGGSGGIRIGTEARLQSGNLNRFDYRRLRSFGASSGRALLALGIGPDGRVTSCGVAGSSGDARLDAEICGILQPRMRWSPARDQYGRPIPVGVRWVATWDRG